MTESLPLVVENLSFRYRDRSGAAIHDISFEAKAGEVLLIAGASGCGKTTLVRGALRALGWTGAVKSPTYAVMEPYEADGFNAWHFDFYRFDDPQEWEDAGFRDVFASEGLKMAEWPEKADGLLPAADLRVTIRIRDDERREVTLDALSERGRELLE